MPTVLWKVFYYNELKVMRIKTKDRRFYCFKKKQYPKIEWFMYNYKEQILRKKAKPKIL